MSIRITKAMAQEAADLISQEYKKAEYSNLVEQRREVAEFLVKEYIPYPVRACVEEYKNYFTYGTYVNIGAYKANVRQRSLVQQVSMKLPSGASYITVEYNEYLKLAKIADKMLRIDDERKELCKSATQTLMTLGTVARVAKELPEALEYLKYQAEKQLPERNYTELRQTLSLIKKINKP